MKRVLLALCMLPLLSCSSNSTVSYPLIMSENSREKVNVIIRNEVIPNQKLTNGELMKRISDTFLGVPYVGNTLIGGVDQQEALVVNLEGVDCFTLLDYITALSKATNEQTFLSALVKVRYKNGVVSYYNRKHFFTDWYAVFPQNAIEITATLSPHYVTVKKNLNQKSDGSEYIKGLGSIPREVTYIAASSVDQHVLNKLQTGDYIGIYSPISGLDVSHTGMVIKKNNQVWYRNASSLSKNMKVVDTLLIDYIASKPGIIVLRPIK